MERNNAVVKRLSNDLIGYRYLCWRLGFFSYPFIFHDTMPNRLPAALRYNCLESACLDLGEQARNGRTDQQTWSGQLTDSFGRGVFRNLACIQYWRVSNIDHKEL